MNRNQTDAAIDLLIESACRALRGDPMTEEEFADRFEQSTDPVRACLNTAVDTMKRRLAEKAEERGD